jgi:hypothetical protein
LTCAALISPLPACTKDPAPEQLARCVAQGTKDNPASAGATAEEVHDAIGEDVAACMKQDGYRHDLADPQCIDDVDFNIHCYTERRHWVLS